MEVADRRIATVHFIFTDHQGKQIASTHGHDPLVYMHGVTRIVPGLEKALEGKNPGDKFTVTIQPEEGFGQRHDELVQTLPLSSMGEGAQLPAIGQKLVAQTARGPLEVIVTAVEGENVTVDGNNPLAGFPFTADVEVVDVRLATPDELQYGQPNQE